MVRSEAEGIPKHLMDACRRLARIPMADAVDSLNAAVAAALVLYEIRRRLR